MNEKIIRAWRRGFGWGKICRPAKREKGYSNIVVLDKHRANLAVLKQVQMTSLSNMPTSLGLATWQRHLSEPTWL
jgi:hypothetical protein